MQLVWILELCHRIWLGQRIRQIRRPCVFFGRNASALNSNRGLGAWKSIHFGAKSENGLEYPEQDLGLETLYKTIHQLFGNLNDFFKHRNVELGTPYPGMSANKFKNSYSPFATVLTLWLMYIPKDAKMIFVLFFSCLR